jgi:hypothetical protein
MDPRITEEALLIVGYIQRFWSKLLKVKIEQPLKTLFPEPSNRGLKHIWKYGSADIVVYRRSRIVAIFEPGGSAHFQDETQMKNDRRKWKLCEINGVRCLRIANGVLSQLSRRQRRNLLGRFIFGIQPK